MTRALLEHAASLAHGWAAGLAVLAVFYAAGVLLTPERWRFRWHDSLVAGAALFIALGWVANTTRDVPIAYVVLAFVGVLCVLAASLRTRQAQASLAARFRSEAARAWLVDFTVLYAMAFILARPAVDAALLPLGSGGSVDLVTYARYAKQVLVQGFSNVEPASFGSARSPATAYVLAAESMFFGREPLDAAVPALLLQAALLGMVARECARSLFGLSRPAGMAIACIIVSGPLARWLLTSYAFAEIFAAVAVLYLAWVIAAVVAGRFRGVPAVLRGAAGAGLLAAAIPPGAGWLNAAGSGLAGLSRAMPVVSVLGLPGAAPAPGDLTAPIRSAAVVVLAALPILWAGTAAVLRRLQVLDRVSASGTDRQLSTALAVYAGAALIIGNVAVQAVRGPASARRPAAWRQLAQAPGLPFGSMTLKVADEPDGLSAALAMYYLPGRTAEVFGRGVSLRALPFDGVSKEHPMFIQNFRCEGVGHDDTLFVAGVGCLLLAPPGMTPGQSYFFNQTYLFLDFDRMTAREPGGRWNVRPTLHLRLLADSQRATLDRPAFLNLLVNPFLPEGGEPRRLLVTWGNGRKGEAAIAQRQWFSLPVDSADWKGNRVRALPVRIDFPDGRTILFHEFALTDSPRGEVVSAR